MTIDAEYKERLIYLQSVDSIEDAHRAADDVLCEFLEKLGYVDLVSNYECIRKWYA